MTDRETGKHSTLMAQAYKRWEDSVPKLITKQDFWDQLNAQERLAVFAGNFNQQVTNGGFSQWHDNGYATEEVVGFLLRLTNRHETETMIKVRALLISFQEVVEIYERDKREGEEEDGWQDFNTNLERLDSAYYEIDECFLDDIENILDPPTKTCSKCNGAGFYDHPQNLRGRHCEVCRGTGKVGVK